ncbi:Alpha/beta-hydrolase [Mycena chlorophos]|uniref:Alpha/beta-hydrolase n=1 Tax=Mycena chlorophos TaxID=658473 RepID=A0A8H6TIF9_MYCCL|nr:Alpha/beta-hydrolase [Mycena chlorophos]
MPLFGGKILGLPSLDQLVNQSPAAQAAGNLGAAFLGMDGKEHISQEKYDLFVHYFKYSSTAYSIILPGPSLIPVRPNGQKMVGKMYDFVTDSHGYVARDDTRKEIVVAFRGSVSPNNFITDAVGWMVDWDSSIANVDAPDGTKIHLGFQHAWSTVAKKTLSLVSDELDTYQKKGYKIITTGHSLGGALASLAAATLKKKFPDVELLVYTYGQPRVGNDVWATWVDNLIPPDHLFRVVHSNDGVPTMAPRRKGFVHHGTEYWALSPHSPQQTYKCDGAGQFEEDPSGSMQIPTLGITPAHLWYFGIFYMTPYLL